MVKEIYEKRALPVMALRNLVVFPEQTVCFEVGRPKSIKAIRNAVDSTDRLIFLVTQKDATVEDPQFSELYDVGVVAEIKQISGVNPLKCMKCGKCSASCPSFNEMDIKPHQFVSYVINEDIEALTASKSLYKCLSCFACVERCPRDVKPGKLIDAARQLVIRQRGQSHLSPDEIPALLDEETPQQLLMSAFRKYRR